MLAGHGRSRLHGHPVQCGSCRLPFIRRRWHGRPQASRQTHAHLADTVTTPAKDQFKKLNEGIAKFYDNSSALFENTFSEHFHHGYYPKGQESKSNEQAQIDMIEEALRWAGVTSADSMVDVGCGIGGSSRYLARKFGCTAQGITLSPKQAARANELSQQQGLADRVSFEVGDALHQPFPDAQFDLVWSLESGEHMPDKTRFVQELGRVCKPGGTIIIVTWCHRNLEPAESALRQDEQAILDAICKAYFLPQWCSVADYERICAEAGLQGVQSADWSAEVAPFWGAVIRTALSPKGLSGLLRSGLGTIRGALVMPLMERGYKKGVVKFNLISARKPAA